MRSIDMSPRAMNVYGLAAEDAGELATKALNMGAADVTVIRSSTPGMFDLQIDWPYLQQGKVASGLSDLLRFIALVHEVDFDELLAQPGGY